MATPSKTACTASGGRRVVIRLRGVSCGVVSAFLVFQLKVIFSQGIHPMVPGGIQVGSGHYISQGICCQSSPQRVGIADTL